MILFAHKHMHQQWCRSNSTTITITDLKLSGIFHELCVEFILPTLIFT